MLGRGGKYMLIDFSGFGDAARKRFGGNDTYIVACCDHSINGYLLWRSNVQKPAIFMRSPTRTCDRSANLRCPVACSDMEPM